MGCLTRGDAMKPLFLWTVRYRRQAWSSYQARNFLTRSAAERLARKLQAPPSWEWSHLSPIVSIELTRRALAEEESVKVWRGRKGGGGSKL